MGVALSPARDAGCGGRLGSFLINGHKRLVNNGLDKQISAAVHP
jgi:hypothetical protein